MLRFTRFIIPLFAAAILTTAAMPQVRRTVVWSGDRSCGWKSAAVPKTEIYNCSTIETDRGSVSVVNHNGVSLSVAFLDQDNSFTVAVEIDNKAGDSLMFDTDNWGAAHFRERSDFFSGKRPLLAETAIPTRDAYRQVNGRAKADNSIDEYLADVQQTVETVELRRQDGTKYRVKKTVPDAAEQEAAESRSESRAMMAKNASEQIRKNALTAKTVSSSSSVKGLVYFRRLKKAGFVVFTFPLDDTNYIFLLPKAEN